MFFPLTGPRRIDSTVALDECVFLRTNHAWHAVTTLRRHSPGPLADHSDGRRGADVVPMHADGVTPIRKLTVCIAEEKLRNTLCSTSVIHKPIDAFLLQLAHGASARRASEEREGEIMTDTGVRAFNKGRAAVKEFTLVTCSNPPLCALLIRCRAVLNI
ncbi:hypothetical protein BJV78DRAFT_260218 [Lactifluus subvellereus]|nr:hypothetical protein BJV78DRAFT_260218 [Lactifluus subvellereus]